MLKALHFITYLPFISVSIVLDDSPPAECFCLWSFRIPCYLWDVESCSENYKNIAVGSGYATCVLGEHF